MERRSPLIVVLLTMVTLGIYGLYWMWSTTRELKALTGREHLHAGLDVLLTLLTLGVWGIWVGYRNAEIVHREMERRGEAHSDRSLPILGLGLLTWVTGLSWLVIAGVLQDDYNQLSDASLSDGFDSSDPGSGFGMGLQEGVL
ncbi:MAG: DUF4234 domain-containing protein [Myxococcota bacterium]